MFEFLGLILNVLDLLLHPARRLLVLLLVHILIVEFDFGYFFELYLGDFLVDVLEFGLVLLLQLVLFLFNGGPNFLDPLLELLLELLQLVLIEEDC